MKIRSAFIVILLLLITTPSWAAPGHKNKSHASLPDTAQSSVPEVSPLQPAVPEALLADYGKIQIGDWFWSLLNDADFISGASTAATDAVHPSTIYVSGPGYIAVSSDNGGSWKIPLTLTQKTRHSYADDRAAADDTPQRANMIREYIREQLRQQPNSEEIELRLDDVSDEELLEAKDITDLDIFQDSDDNLDERIDTLRDELRDKLEQQYDSDYVDSILDDMSDEELLEKEGGIEFDNMQEIEMNIDTDLTKISFDSAGGGSFTLSEFDPFIYRYRHLINAGAMPEKAIPAAALNNAAWKILSHAQGTYAVTSDAVYLTRNQGVNWDIFMTPSDGESILSLDISPDGRTILIGMTDGVIMSSDSGINWIRADADLSGAVYDIHFGSSVWYALTTNGIRCSNDNGTTWMPVDTPFSVNEYPVALYPGNGGALMALTNQAIYYTGDGSAWNVLPTPFSDELVLGMTVDDPTFKTFIVQTDSHIYEYKNGWLNHNKGMNADSTGQVIRLHSEKLLAMMTNSTGVWIAYPSKDIEDSDPYRRMEEIWKNEPSDDAVINAAFAAHYIDGQLEKKWQLRSRLAWILPSVRGDFYFNEKRTDKETHSQEQATFLSTHNYSYDRDSSHYWEIYALWDLQIEQAFKADFEAESIENLRLKRTKIFKAVMDLLHKRRAIQVADVLSEIQEQEISSAQAVKNILSMQEIEANLHYLTGGYYLPAIRQNNRYK